MISILFLGLLIGMQHALEADHMAAVSSMISDKRSIKKMVAQGAIWGIGHAFTLMLVGGLVILTGLGITATLAGWLEFAVGLMLVFLGLQLLYRLYRDKVHFHFHRHDNQPPHLHAHSHAYDRGDHKYSRHIHRHGKLPLRSLLVGMMHGMAGSAALLILTATQITDPLHAIGYILVFGFGSVLGMAALSAVIAVPLSYSARFLTWANRGLQTGIGAGTAALGVLVCYKTGVISTLAG